MAGIRVDRLDLRLRTPEGLRGRAVQLQSATEGEFVPAVLRAMHRRLRICYGEAAVIRIRRLSFNCTMRPDSLADAAFVEAIADDLAASVAASVTRDHGYGALPSPHAAAQVYRDSAHATAAALIAAAERRTGPEGAAEDFAALWQALVREAPPTVSHVLARCQMAEKLTPVLTRLDLPALVTLENLAAATTPAVKAEIRAARVAAARRADRANPRSGRVRTGGRGQEAPASASPTDPLTPATPHPAATTPVTEPGQSSRPVATSPKTATPALSNAVGSDSDRPDDATAAKSPPTSTEVHPTSRPVPRPADEPALYLDPATSAATDDDLADPDNPTAVAADWCGLLYLVNIAQRLDFPERLWQAGVDEGRALSSMLRVLGGEDPATRILSPIFPDPPPPLASLADWAREELTAGLTTAGAALVARSLDRPALETRIATIAAWFAADGFAGWAAACHLAVFEAMTGEAVVPGALAERFRRPGRIEADGGTIRIVQPMDAIDTGVRLAGLDADPGWLAWLSRSLVFVFEDGAS